MNIHTSLSKLWDSAKEETIEGLAEMRKEGRSK